MMILPKTTKNFDGSTRRQSAVALELSLKTVASSPSPGLSAWPFLFGNVQSRTTESALQE
jgi:hypothetical protein